MRGVSVALLSLAALCSGAEWNAFQVTYGQNGKGYYDMPWSVSEATAQGKWAKISEDRPLNVDIYSQPDDPRLMLLMDKNGNIAGLRMAFLKEDVATKAKSAGIPFEFHYDNNPLYDSGNYLGKDLWYTTVLFASPQKLKSGGRRKNINKQRDNVAEGVFWRADGKWVEMNRDECHVNPGFTEGNCFAGMGKHYFYKLDKSDNNCAHRQPFFALYDNQGKLMGVGLSGYGAFSKHPNTQSYFEEFPVGAVKSIMPNAPDCVEEYIRKYGLTNMHVYLKKDAAKLTCPPQDWRKQNCKN